MLKQRLTLPDSAEFMRLREQKGWTQERLAERAGCSPRTVQRAEHGDALRASIIDELAGALECQADDISLNPPSEARVADGFRDRRIWKGFAIGVIAAAMVAGLARLAPPARSTPRLVGIPLVGDVDDDGRDDLVLWEPSTGRWHALRADGRKVFPEGGPVLGLDGDIPFTAKLSEGGDALAIWRPALGKWYAVKPTGETLFRLDGEPVLGRAGDVALAADLDGNGIDELINWHPSDAALWSAVAPDGTMVLSDSSWGRGGDEPKVGDFDGDGSADLGIWRPSTGRWFARKSVEFTVLFRRIQWGKPGDIALLGDFDGDGRTDLAVWTPSTGVWAARVAPSSEAQDDAPEILFRGLVFGQPGDYPLTGDFDGDGRDELCLWRPADGEWLGVEVDGTRLFRIEMTQ